MGNISIFCNSNDHYVKYGLHHFEKKYGFVHTDRGEGADISVNIGSEINSSGVRITMKKPIEDIPSYLNIHGESIPIFRRPTETSGGNSLASVICGQGEYPCVSVDNRAINIGFDAFGEIGRILAGHYDNYFQKNDQLGAKLRSTPVVDVLEDCLFSGINLSMTKTLATEGFRWPENRRFVLVLTHDVDQVSKSHHYVSTLLKSIKRANIPELGHQIISLLFKHGKNDPYWTFDTMCALENSLGVKSTSYFLNESGRVNPFDPKSWVVYSGRYNVNRQHLKDLLMELNNKGFEIGIHGSYNSYSSQQLLNSEKRLMESITGAEIAGIRQHYLNYDQNITPLIHNKCGFKYDTSIGFKPNVGNGFRRGTSFPFPIMLPDLSVSPLLEIPLIIMDTAIGSTATEEECFRLLDQVEKYQGVLTILWHSKMFCAKEFPGLFKLYGEIIKEAKKRGAWVARASDVYKWVTQTENNIGQKSEAEITV